MTSEGVMFVHVHSDCVLGRVTVLAHVSEPASSTSWRALFFFKQFNEPASETTMEAVTIVGPKLMHAAQVGDARAAADLCSLYTRVLHTRCGAGIVHAAIKLATVNDHADTVCAIACTQWPFLYLRKISMRFAMMDAARAGSDCTICALLCAKAEVDGAASVHGFCGPSPLSAATHRGHLSTVKLLLLARADPHARTADGATALDVAVRLGHVEIADEITNRAAGADPAPPADVHLVQDERAQ